MRINSNRQNQGSREIERNKAVVMKESWRSDRREVRQVDSEYGGKSVEWRAKSELSGRP